MNKKIDYTLITIKMCFIMYVLEKTVKSIYVVKII